jgi:putative ABC transport system permease protein
MFHSYFIIGLRNLLKQKIFSIIKILGLALGLATSIVLFLYIQEDLSYDQYNKNYDQQKLRPHCTIAHHR